MCELMLTLQGTTKLHLIVKENEVELLVNEKRTEGRGC